MSGIQSIITEKKTELKLLNAEREVLLRQIGELEADAKKLAPKAVAKPVTKPAVKPTTPARKAGKTK